MAPMPYKLSDLPRATLTWTVVDGDKIDTQIAILFPDWTNKSSLTATATSVYNNVDPKSTHEEPAHPPILQIPSSAPTGGYRADAPGPAHELHLRLDLKSDDSNEAIFSAEAIMPTMTSQTASQVVYLEPLDHGDPFTIQQVGQEAATQSFPASRQPAVGGSVGFSPPPSEASAQLPYQAHIKKTVFAQEKDFPPPHPLETLVELAVRATRGRQSPPESNKLPEQHGYSECKQENWIAIESLNKNKPFGVRSGDAARIEIRASVHDGEDGECHYLYRSDPIVAPEETYHFSAADRLLGIRPGGIEW